MSNKLTIFVPASMLLQDNAQYTNRFKIRSSSSGDIYIVAQNKSGRWWSCGCFGWIRHKHCKHLRELGLPGHHVPFEAQLAEGKK
jgi:hypothetical protein